MVSVTDGYLKGFNTAAQAVDSSSAMAHTSGCDATNAVFFYNGCSAAAYQVGVAESINGLNTGTGHLGSQRHLEGANYLFCDGHVKWYSGSSTTGTSNKVWNAEGHLRLITGNDPTFSGFSRKDSPQAASKHPFDARRGVLPFVAKMFKATRQLGIMAVNRFT